MTDLITNDDGSIEFECPHYIPYKGSMGKCSGLFPCEDLFIYNMSIPQHCTKGIVSFNWIDRLKIVEIKRLKRMISLRFYKQ